jgi:hypothetical protein
MKSKTSTLGHKKSPLSGGSGLGSAYDVFAPIRGEPQPQPHKLFVSQDQPQPESITSSEFLTRSHRLSPLSPGLLSHKLECPAPPRFNLERGYAKVHNYLSLA